METNKTKIFALSRNVTDGAAYGYELQVKHFLRKEIAERMAEKLNKKYSREFYVEEIEVEDPQTRADFHLIFNKISNAL